MSRSIKIQTFFPVPNSLVSADILDKKRCFKNLVESQQILNTIEGRSKGWINHPAVKMWVGHANALKDYSNSFFDICINKHKINIQKLKKYKIVGNILYPKWVGDERFHSSHRSNLLRKDKIYYSKFGWTETPNLPYWWPI